MSWVSSFWQRNKSAIGSIVKPLVGKIPVVGDLAASRINMSPTPNESALSAQTALAAGALQPAIAAVNKDALNQSLGAPKATVLSPQPMYLAIAVVVLLVLFLLLRKR